MIGDMPDGNNRNAELCVRPGIAALYAIEGILRRERGKDAVRVIERVLQIFDQLGLCFRRIVATLFAVVRWLLALEFVEEGKLGAGDVLDLLSEAADVVELACSRDKGILVFRHRFSDAEETPFSELEGSADDLGNTRMNAGNVTRTHQFAEDRKSTR